MKKFLLGCGVIVLLGLSIPGYFLTRYYLRQQFPQGDCKTVRPTVDVFVDVMTPFYRKVIEQEETPGLALRTAAKVEAALPKLTLIKLKDASLNDDHQLVIANMKLFVTDARDWATAYQPGNYLSFASKRARDRPRGFHNVIAGGLPMYSITYDCN